MGHGKSIPLSKPYVIPQVTPPYKYADGSLPYSQTFGIEIEDPHVDTNKLWTRLQQIQHKNYLNFCLNCILYDFIF